MRNIYWGAYNSGKFHMKMIHRASCVEQLRFNESGHSCNVLQYDGEVENELLYYKDEKGGPAYLARVIQILIVERGRIM